MSRSTFQLSEKVHDYLLGHSLRESTFCQQLREETRPMKMGMMQVSPEQGQFMAFLVEPLPATVRCASRRHCLQMAHLSVVM